MDKKEKVVCCAIKYIPITRYFSTKIKHEDKYRICLCILYENAYIAEAHTESIKGFMTNKNRFVDAKEAMKIAVKSGQYPDYEFRKKVCLHAIEEANENKKHNQENIGFDGQLYVADIGYLENKIKEYDSLLERDELKPEDLY